MIVRNDLCQKATRAPRPRRSMCRRQRSYSEIALIGQIWDNYSMRNERSLQFIVPHWINKNPCVHSDVRLVWVEGAHCLASLLVTTKCFSCFFRQAHSGSFSVHGGKSLFSQRTIQQMWKEWENTMFQPRRK